MDGAVKREATRLKWDKFGIIPAIGDLTLTSRQRWSHPLIDNANNPQNGDFNFHHQTFAEWKK